MITFLARAEHAERTIEPEDLDALARMLADWRFQFGGPAVTQRITVSLWGFPKAEYEQYRARAATRANAAEMEVAEPTDPNVLTLKSAETTMPRSLNLLPHPPDRSGYLRFLLDPAFDGLCAEIRITTGDGAGGVGDVVLWGVVRSRRYRVRAAWATEPGMFQDEAFVFAQWPQEASLFTALHDYKSGRNVPPDWAQTELFPKSAGRGVSHFIVWFLRPFSDGFGPFLTRVGLSGGIAAVCAALLFAFRPQMSFLLSYPLVVLLILASLGFVFKVIWALLQTQMALSLMRDNLKKAYQQTIDYPETDWDADPIASADPALTKMTRDIEALGGQRFRDVRMEPPIAGGFYLRLFTFPEDNSVFLLMIMHDAKTHRLFPGQPRFLLRTAFENGGRLFSTNGAAGYRKRLNPSVIERVSEGVTDPEVFLNKHREGLLQMAARGKTPKPVRPEEIIADVRRDQEEAKAALERYGYFHWDDAVRMVFHAPRPENRA